MKRFRHLAWDGKRCLVMAVLNVTPDSFSDGGDYFSVEAAVRAGQEFFAQGADIVDIGGESTRPGSQPVSLAEESRRVLGVIEKLANFGTVSIDTSKAEVARLAILAGAEIVNDVSGGTIDPKLLPVVAHQKVTLIMGHIRGTPERMGELANYDNVVQDVRNELKNRVNAAQAAGIAEQSIWIDPGLGFAKRAEHNLALVGNLSELVALGYPVVVGASRKAFLGELTGRSTLERDVATAAVHAIAIFQGASVIRAHNVKASVDARAAATALYMARSSESIGSTAQARPRA